MNKLKRLVTYPLFLMPALFAPASLLAQSPFDGTWLTNEGQSKLSQQPYVFSVNKGIYDSPSYNPKIHVKADGTDQPVMGQFWDSISVREVDPKSIAVTGKKAGKIIYEQIRTVSDDGNTLTSKQAFHPETGNEVMNSEATYTRLGTGPAGANGTSGSWRMNALKMSENARATTYKSAGDELSMSDPTGESYTAKLDGKDYPVKGAYSYNVVSLTRINERTIVETDNRDGKVVYVSRMTVSPDGKKMTVVFTDKRTGRTSTSVADKQ